jgi:hypothetical protein
MIIKHLFSTILFFNQIQYLTSAKILLTLIYTDTLRKQMCTLGSFLLEKSFGKYNLLQNVEYFFVIISSIFMTAQ